MKCQNGSRLYWTRTAVCMCFSGRNWNHWNYEHFSRCNPSSPLRIILLSRPQLSMYHQTLSHVWPSFSLAGPKPKSGGLVHPGFMFPVSSCLMQWQDSTLPTTKTRSSCFHIWGHCESEWVSTNNANFNTPVLFLKTVLEFDRYYLWFLSVRGYFCLLCAPVQV